MKVFLLFLFFSVQLLFSASSAELVATQESQAKQLGQLSTIIEMHKSNYILPVSYSSRPNQERFEYIQTYSDIDSVELKYQISFKLNLTTNNEENANGVYVAYTQTSWWQTYNGGASRPFRETNYLPEVFWQFAGRDNELLGFTNHFNRLGLAHLSNGSTRPQSRTRNYLYLSTAWEQGAWQLQLIPRIKLPDVREGEANSDLEKYIGHLDARLRYQSSSQQVYSLTTKGNPLYGHYGAQLDWSFPLYRGIHGLIQVYAGYAESLIDYDHENYRVSMGFTLAPPKL